MGLPVVASYPMPDRTALSRSRIVEFVDNVATLRGLAPALGVPVAFNPEPVGSGRVGEPPGQRELVTDVWDPGIGGEPDAAASSLHLRREPKSA